MIGPLIYDLAQQHVSELLAEREMDRLAAQATRPAPDQHDFGRFLRGALAVVQ